MRKIAMILAVASFAVAGCGDGEAGRVCEEAAVNWPEGQDRDNLVAACVEDTKAAEEACNGDDACIDDVYGRDE